MEIVKKILITAIICFLLYFLKDPLGNAICGAISQNSQTDFLLPLFSLLFNNWLIVICAIFLLRVTFLVLNFIEDKEQKKKT